MKDFFKQDSMSVALVAALGSMLLSAALVLAVLLCLGLPLQVNFRWFALAFVAPVIIYRFYVKAKVYPTVSRIMIGVIFASFILFMFFYLKLSV